MSLEEIPEGFGLTEDMIDLIVKYLGLGSHLMSQEELFLSAFTIDMFTALRLANSPFPEVTDLKSELDSRK